MRQSLPPLNFKSQPGLNPHRAGLGYVRVVNVKDRWADAVLSAQEMQGIGRRLRLARKDRELTQDQVAVICGVSKSAVSHWEAGRNVPDTLYCYRLAKGLGLSLDHLLLGTGHSPEVLNLAARIAAVPPAERAILLRLLP